MMRSPLVLVVDDEAPIREIVRRYLTADGIDVVEAAAPFECPATSAIRDGPPGCWGQTTTPTCPNETAQCRAEYAFAAVPRLVVILAATPTPQAGGSRTRVPRQMVTPVTFGPTPHPELGTR